MRQASYGQWLSHTQWHISHLASIARTNLILEWSKDWKKTSKTKGLNYANVQPDIPNVPCFPTDPSRRSAWLAKIQIKGLFYNSARIYSEHFKSEDYDPERPGFLLKNAVPHSAYKLCVCCNTAECINMPSTSEPKSTEVVSNLAPMLHSQIECVGDENQIPIKRRAFNQYWTDINAHISSTTSSLSGADNNMAILASPAQQIVQEGEPPLKRPALKDFNVQVHLKTTRKQILVQQNKNLRQRVKRQGHKIKDLKSIINVVRIVFGYVDLVNIPVNDPEQLASECLVFQIVSCTNYFKCPIGYFFTHNCPTGELLGQLINTAITMLHDIGITVRSLTCDGAKSNIKAYEFLGCSLLENDLRPYFHHINGISNFISILDPAHMLKHARNVLADKGFKTAGGEISFKYIQELHKVQEEEGLKLTNKITGVHVDFNNKKMNVRLAAQVLSSSVADAIDYLRNKNVCVY
ncbi:hypothetical protein evm_007650 [Chilo suppressalis]|nr:hypothetical protein evm_007650 [Chilo suppressalis]